MADDAISPLAEEFLQLDPQDRGTVAVLDADELLELRKQSGGRAARVVRSLKQLAGAGGGAAVAAPVAGGAGLAPGAAALALAPALGPLVVGGALGLGVVVALGGKKGMPQGVQLIDEETAGGLSCYGRPLQKRLLYCVHPARGDRYLPYGAFYRDLLAERAREAEAFFLHCGASRIELTVEYGADLNLSGGVDYREPRFSLRAKTKARRAEISSRSSVIEARGFKSPRKIRSSEWTWANLEPDWLELHAKRRKFGIHSYELSTIMEEERGLTADVAAKLPKLASIRLGGSAEKFEKTKWTWHVRFPE